MTPHYKEWKEQELQTLRNDLSVMGYVPTAIDSMLEMVEELMDHSYELGQGDSYYNDDEGYD